MSNMLGNHRISESDSIKFRLWIIGGERFRNTAARFWDALLQEAVLSHAGCHRLVLETLSAVLLERVLLFPESVRDALEGAGTADSVGKALKAALIELEICGMPCAVEISMYDKLRELQKSVLPLDCVDADIFAYLTAWLLEWAGLPEYQWMDEKLTGSFGVGFAGSITGILIRFVFERLHLSEGLFRWRLDLAWREAPSVCDAR